MDPGGSVTGGDRRPSPTLTSPAMTQAESFSHTAAYMSPEQARGRDRRQRADIWAFGCVLYEMLTGERLFAGDDLTETLASVVKDQPDFSKAPPQVARLLRRCLEKDPRRRLRDLGDAWDLLDEPRASAPGSSATPAVSKWRALAGWALAAVLAIAFAGSPRCDGARRQPSIPAARVPAVARRGSGPQCPPSLQTADGGVIPPNGARFMLRSLETGEVAFARGTEQGARRSGRPTAGPSRSLRREAPDCARRSGGPENGLPRVGIGGGGTWSAAAAWCSRARTAA